MNKQWLLSELAPRRIGMALHTHILQTEKEGIPECGSSEVQDYLQELNELATRINEIGDAFGKDRDEQEWVERDQTVVRITQKQGDERYTVVPWGTDPVGGRRESQSRSASRRASLHAEDACAPSKALAE